MKSSAMFVFIYVHSVHESKIVILTFMSRELNVFIVLVKKPLRYFT